MQILADTNILLRLVETGHAQHATTVSAVRELRHAGHPLVLVPQVIYEYWVVATRPMGVNGLGLNTLAAKDQLANLASTFKLLRDERSIFELWQSLVYNEDVVGKQAHDARIVAAMIRHGVSYLLTFNVSDFQRYQAIRVIDPVEAISFPAPGQ